MVKQKDLKEMETRLEKRIGTMNNQVESFLLEFNKDGSFPVFAFSLADAIDAIADHLGLEFSIQKKKLVLTKKSNEKTKMKYRDSQNIYITRR